MNVLFTCGGTGGHINPAIAVANIWKERHPQDRILFVGVKGHMEEQLVPKAGFALKTIPSTGMARGFSWGALCHNVKAVGRVLGAVGACKKILKEFKPDVILGTGGYASFPSLMAGTLLKIPTCVHEANAMPGLTTRLVADRVDQVLVCFEESAAHYRHPEKVRAVGMPVRREFVFTRREEARKALGLGEEPLVVSAFGSQGARVMNEAVLEMLALEKEADFPFHHIHAAGSYGWEWMPERVTALGVDVKTTRQLDLREFIYDMPLCLAAADVVIGRAGSSTCNEIAAAGIPCILIPSPNVTDNHQEKNACALESKGGAVVLLEKDCTGKALYEQTVRLLADSQGRAHMRKALHAMAVPDSAERICDIMEQLARGKKE